MGDGASMRQFVDRVDAGRQLAAKLGHLRGEAVVVVGLPRGGVPVAAEVAKALDAPLDVIVVRKLGVPLQPELGMGAIGEEGARVLDDEIVRLARVSPLELAAVEQRERAELDRRCRLYRGRFPAVALAGRTVVIVDDGMATGSTARAACAVAHQRGAARVVLAMPVAPRDWEQRLAGEADDFVAVQTPWDLDAVGHAYRDFRQVSDDAVRLVLEDAYRRPEKAARDEEVSIAVRGVTVAGYLHLPPEPTGIVIFAHGSGSSRHSPRNRQVAEVLQRAGIATLLFDLLTMTEQSDRDRVFDVDLLADRLAAVTAWVRRQPGLDHLRICYFGASTGTAAALVAAAAPDAGITAIVSRGGRPDLAGAKLGAVTAPTLLIVGSEDRTVTELNQRAARLLGGESRLAVVPGATHLFEEPGTLDAAADEALRWFERFLPRRHLAA